MQKNELEYIDLDFDNLVYDLESLNLKFVKDHYGVTLKSRDITHWNFYLTEFPEVEKIWGDFKLYSKAKFFENAKQFYEDLYSIKKVRIITASYPQIEKEKDKMIFDFFQKEVEIIHARDKYLFTKKSVLIDDTSGHIEKHVINNNNYGILFDLNGQYGWNKDCMKHDLIIRATSYDEVLTNTENIFRNLTK